MGYIIVLIVSLLVGIVIVFIFATFAVVNQSNAKKVAKKILAGRDLANISRINHVMRTLDTMPEDLEAKDLWQKLLRLKNTKCGFSCHR